MSFLSGIGSFLKKAVGEGENLLGINNGPSPGAAGPAPPQAAATPPPATPLRVQNTPTPDLNVATQPQHLNIAQQGAIPTFSYKITPPPQQQPLSKIGVSPPQNSTLSSVGGQAIQQVPNPTDQQGLTNALHSLNAYGPDDQVRILDRAARFGLQPGQKGRGLIAGNVAAALTNQINGPTQETDRSKVDMFGQALGQTLLPGYSVYKQIGNTLGENKLYDQALKGQMPNEIAQATAAQANADNGNIANQYSGINSRQLAGAGINEGLKAASFGLGAAAAKTPATLLGATKTAVKTGAGFGVAGGVGQTLSEDNPTLGDLGKNIARNTAQMTALGALPAVGVALDRERAPLDERGSLGFTPNHDQEAESADAAKSANWTKKDYDKALQDNKTALTASLKSGSIDQPTHDNLLAQAQKTHDDGIASLGQVKRTQLSGQALDKTNKQLTEPAMADEVKPTKNLNEGAFGPEDQKFLQKQLDLGDLGQGKLSAEEYAQKYNVTPLQAEKDFQDMAKEARNSKNITADNLDRFGPPLTIRQRRELIANDPNQQTFNQVPLDVPQGNDRGAIAQATGVIAERDSRFNDAERLGNKLSDHDKDLLYRYDNGEPVESLAKEADNPEAFVRAADSAIDALDYSLAADRAAGGTTLRQQTYMPHYYQATPEMMDKLGIPENQRVKIGKEYRGYRDDSAKYRSYMEANQKAGLKPLFPNLFDAMKEYNDKGRFKIQNQLLATALAKSNPDEIGTLDTVRGPAGDRFTQAAGKLPFAVSDRLNKRLAAFKDAYQPKSTAGQIALKSANTANHALKKSLFALTPFHYANEEAAFAGTTIFTHPDVFVKGNARALFSQVGGYNHIIDHARQDGTLEWARLSGLPIKEMPTSVRLGKLNILAQANIKLGQFGNTLMLEMARFAKNHDIDPRSELGVQVAAEYGKVIGNINEAVQGIDPNMQKIFSQGALAPYWLRTRLGLVKDAVDYSSLHATGKTGIGLRNPGDIARSAVIGQRGLEAAIAIIGSAIATGALPTVKQMINEAGFNPNNPTPNIEGNAKNKKGEAWAQELPTDPLGLAATIATDPQHAAASRYAPLLSATSRFATNKDWNGLPLADPNAPNYELKRTEGALKGFLPISLQNATNPNISIKQGLLEDVGVRYKINPNDPQAKANKDYYTAFGQTSNQLKQSGPYGQYWAQQFANLHPQNTTDASGNKYPTPYNPVSSEAKYAAYTTVDQNGKQTLSPVFYADQKLNQLTPGYPHSPLYDLKGNGTDVNGNTAPQALVALQYQHAQDPAAKTDIMNANGGQNGWLAAYENKVGDYSKNYQQNLTNYFQGLGWSTNAINDYWSKHPSTPDPIDQVNFDKPTTDTINQYYQLSASGDSTAASQFFSKNADVLGPAFDQLAQHANALRSAKGELQLQGYPAESQHVKDILSSMPSGSDPASKKARAQLINGNSDVSQYLTDIALYETLAKGAQFRYKLPGSMGATEAQNINNGGQAGQTFMKDVSSLAKYGIAFNPTTNSYSIIQNGQAPAGSTIGGKVGSGSHKKPKLYLARTNLKNRHIKLRSTRKVAVAYPRQPGKVKDEGRVLPIKLGGGVNDRSIRLV